METPITASPRGEIAPTVVLIGDIVIRILEYAEHLDFLLSVRDEKVATLLEVYRNIGWWVIGLASLVWLLYEIKRRKTDANARGSIGSLIASTAFVSFLLGSVITVRATGSLPNIVMTFGGAFDPAKQTASCTADIDTSRLAGFADDYRIILICGAVDATMDYLDDTRIAVSAPFHIKTNSSGMGIMGIVAPIGKLADILKTVGSPPSGSTPPPGQSFVATFQMWHAIAIIPRDVQSDSVKKVSDVKQLGGRILTEGANASPMQIPIPTPQAPSQTTTKLTQN